MRSFQWVYNRPVWLITRPNCRHYFAPVGLAEAASKSDAEILRARDMISEVGKKGSRQTIKHSTKREWYTESNVDSIIKKYEDRKKLLEAMRKEHPTPALEADIRKVDLMIKKWKAFRKRTFGK